MMTIKMTTAKINKTIEAAFSTASNANTLKKVLPFLVADESMTSAEALEEMNKFYIAVQAAK